MPRVKSNDFTRTVKFYNDEFKLIEEPVTGTVTTFPTYEEAFNAVGQEKALEAINQVSRQAQIDAKVAEKTGGIEERYVMAFIKPYRLMAPFDAIKDEKEQTTKILEQVRSVPFLLDGLKSYCKNRATEGDEE